MPCFRSLEEFEFFPIHKGFPIFVRPGGLGKGERRLYGEATKRSFQPKPCELAGHRQRPHGAVRIDTLQELSEFFQDFRGNLHRFCFSCRLLRGIHCRLLRRIHGGRCRTGGGWWSGGTEEVSSYIYVYMRDRMSRLMFVLISPLPPASKPSPVSPRAYSRSIIHLTGTERCSRDIPLYSLISHSILWSFGPLNCGVTPRRRLPTKYIISAVIQMLIFSDSANTYTTTRMSITLANMPRLRQSYPVPAK
jgi:hypothetical protein